MGGMGSPPLGKKFIGYWYLEESLDHLRVAKI